VITSVLDAAAPAPGDESGADREFLRHIAVLPTGAGKSLCWMLPAVMIQGITVAVFPLLSLMADQRRRLDGVGVPSVTLRGGQSVTERRRVWKELESGKCRIVLANPEVLSGEQVARRLETLKPLFFVVDETHTVSQWGESFRPACAGMGSLVKRWNPRAVLALTATAGPLLRERITELLFNGDPPTQALADPDRPAIRYGVIPALSRNHALERLVRQERRPLIVFGPTRPSVVMAARMLRSRLDDLNIRYYHAGLTREEKERLEAWFLGSADAVLCATCAYGMGVDKSDVRTVVHLAPPSSIEAYLQESGRAARDGGDARSWLIWTPDDLWRPEGEHAGPLKPVPLSPEPTVVPGAVRDGEYRAESAGLERRRRMLLYAASPGRCRRETLLEAVGIEASDCAGCDVCGGEAWSGPPEKEIIMNVFRRNPRRFRPGQAARVLIGRRTAEIRRAGLDSIRGFGALGSWELEDAEEAIRALTGSGELSIAAKGPWKGRIVPVRRRGNTAVPGGLEF
jgi:ATP-dependent DNA helicase RecQ